MSRDGWVRQGAWVLSLLASAPGAGAAGPPPQAMGAAARAGWLRSEAGLGVTPVREVVRAPMGQPTVVPFRVREAAPFHRSVPVKVVEGGCVRVRAEGQVAPGATTGFAVMEGVAEFETDVLIGGTPVAVSVVRAGAVAGWPSGPRIVTPLDGAAVWGTVGVGVTWWRPGAPDAAAPALWVGTRRIEPVWTTTEADGPVALAAYEVDAGALAAGECELWVEGAGGAGAAESAAVRVRVIHPEVTDLQLGECEATYDLPPLPEEKRERPATITRDARASGGAYFNSAGSATRFRVPVDVIEGVGPGRGPGWYQVLLRAGGDEACSTLPSVGVSIDEAQYPATRAAIAMPGFHRVPVGLPVRLEPGRRVLRLDFLNDFYAAGGADRNLRLDKIEIVRVADAAGAGAGASESAMMMSEAGGTMAAAPMMIAGTASPAMEGGDGAMLEGVVYPADPVDRWPESAALRAGRGDPPVIAFARPLDGAVVAGDVEIRCVAWWPGIGDRGGATPARTTLMLNGAAFAGQIAAAPRFVVPWSALAPGENTVWLLAESGAFTVRSAEARVVARKPAASLTEPAAPGANFHRFTVHDPRWDAAARSLVTDQQSPPERICFGLASNADLDLRLPAELEGEFRVEVEARGQHFRGGPELAVSLGLPGEGEPAAIGSLVVPTFWGEHAVLRPDADEKNRRPATVTLGPGPKRLRVSFTNDLYEPDQGDRNVYVQAVVLRPAVAAAEREAPSRVRVTYPAPDQDVRAGGADAVVFEVDGPAAPRTAEVLVDDRPTGQIIDLRGRPGPYVAPVALRGIGEGSRRLTVRIADARGRGSMSEPVTVRAIGAASADPTPYERAVVVLDRFGFGPDEGELAAALAMGARPYLESRLSDGPEAASVRAGRDLAAARYPNSSSAADVQRRAILEALATDNPVRARFVFWAQNHFSTWIRKTEARRKADEHARFAALGVAPFDRLLLASATSPAMLRYLDQEQSFARRLNENYAREIMELHTLGVHGGYTQEDVTTLARILTGWTTAREGFVVSVDAEDGESVGVGPDEYGLRESFRFDPVLSDGQARTLLGLRFPAAGPEERYRRVLSAIGVLANHPSTARFIARKLAEHYVGVPAPDALVDDLASTFERTGGDMGAMLLAISDHPAFWAAAAATPRLAHPPDFAFRLSRCVRSLEADGVQQYLNLSGRGMFDRSTPDGYQEDDRESMDSNAMLQRWKFARRLEGPLLELIASADRAGDKPIGDDDAQRAIDLVAIRLTGRLLGEASNTAAMDLLRSTASKDGKSAGGGRRDERWRAVATFIASTPEAQLR